MPGDVIEPRARPPPPTSQTSSVASPHSSRDVSAQGQELAHRGREKSEGRALLSCTSYLVRRLKYAETDYHSHLALRAAHAHSFQPESAANLWARLTSL